MAEEQMGILSLIDLVMCVETSASLGRTDEAAGTSRTSSKVRASPESLAVGLWAMQAVS
jgi:hypothetical protein